MVSKKKSMDCEDKKFIRLLFVVLMFNINHRVILHVIELQCMLYL